MKYIDVHSHIRFDKFDEDRGGVLERMRELQVGAIEVGVDLKSSALAVDFASLQENIYATVGLHPNYTETKEFDAGAFLELASHSKVIGVGECGLDYYRNDAADEKMKKRQHDAFVSQIEFALRLDKPLMLHCRPSAGSMDAYEDVISILKGFPKVRGNVHFFVGNVDIAKAFLEIGFTMSFTGVVTFARDYDETVRFLPLDAMLSETDSPYAAPTPHRGKRNEPTYVIEVVKALASIRGEDEEEMRQALLKNAEKTFGIAV